MPRSPRKPVRAKYFSRRAKREGHSPSSSANFDSLIIAENPRTQDASFGSSGDDEASTPPPSLHQYKRGSRYHLKPTITAVAVLLAEDERRLEEEASSPPARELKQWNFIRALDSYSLDLEVIEKEGGVVVCSNAVYI